MNRTLVLFGLALLMGCNEAMVSPSRVDKLHLLAVQAEPPEIAPEPLARPAAGSPPSRARLTSLVADPRNITDPAHRVTVLYFGCTPSLEDLGGSLCASLDTLRGPPDLQSPAGQCLGAGSAVGAFGQGIAGGITFAGVEECDAQGCRSPTISLKGTPVAMPEPAYVLPPELRLDGLPTGAPERILGTQISILALVVDAAPEELVAVDGDGCLVSSALSQLMEERQHVLAIKRIHVRGPDANDEPDLNPRLGAIGVVGETDSDAAFAFSTGEKRDLVPVALSGFGPQTFTRYDATGQAIESKQEKWAFAWFATAGEFEETYTRSFDKAQRWTAPDAAEMGDVPGGAVRFYLVVRDLRGGLGWAIRDGRKDFLGLGRTSR